MRNQELFNKIADQIEAHPESHDQLDWGNSCGTEHCIAGWAAHLSGWRPTVGRDFVGWDHVTKGQDSGYIWEVASDLLGVGDRERLLFYERWTSEDVPASLRSFGAGAEIV